MLQKHVRLSRDGCRQFGSHKTSLHSPRPGSRRDSSCRAAAHLGRRMGQLLVQLTWSNFFRSFLGTSALASPFDWVCPTCAFQRPSFLMMFLKMYCEEPMTMTCRTSMTTHSDRRQRMAVKIAPIELSSVVMPMQSVKLRPSRTPLALLGKPK